MTDELKARWLKRAAIKLEYHNDNMSLPSGHWLNEQAGLPSDAVWREENFA